MVYTFKNNNNKKLASSLTRNNMRNMMLFLNSKNLLDNQQATRRQGTDMKFRLTVEKDTKILDLIAGKGTIWQYPWVALMTK